jgi:hypothetical protein
MTSHVSLVPCKDLLLVMGFTGPGTSFAAGFSCPAIDVGTGHLPGRGSLTFTLHAGLAFVAMLS